VNEHVIRFAPDVWSAIRIQAERQGVSAAGALSYAAFCAARNNDEVTAGFDALWAAARELLQHYPL
jgi:hypothetical protein